MKSLKGCLLIATPQLSDPNFAKTVLLIFEHSEEGAAGVILNRSSETTVTEVSGQLLDEAIEWEKLIHLGGPVTGPLMALHTEQGLADREALPGIYLTIEAAKIQDILRLRVEPSLIVANYAGWGPGQLDRELAEESWYHLPAKADSVLGGDEADLWEAVIREVRRSRVTELLNIREVPDDPQMN